MKPTAETLREWLSYDAASGHFTWLVQRRNAAQIGSRAGKINWNGYVHIRINNRAFMAHRLAWLYMVGEWPSHFVDHIDGNPSNNAWSNLRAATNSQNQAARRATPNGEFRGTTWNKSAKKWQAGIKVGGKSFHLGVFASRADAAEAYKSAAVEHFGQFAHGRAA